MSMHYFMTAVVTSAALAGSLFAATAANAAGNFTAQRQFAASATQVMTSHVCMPPRHMSRVCIAWGKGAPGTFAGPCIHYVNRCVADSVVR